VGRLLAKAIFDTLSALPKPDLCDVCSIRFVVAAGPFTRHTIIVPVPGEELASSGEQFGENGGKQFPGAEAC
jgi:hypothetical protein